MSTEPNPSTTTINSISGRLERLPFSIFHKRFIAMIATGEFIETLMLLGNGVVLVLIASTLHFSTTMATKVVPDAFFVGEFVGAIGSGYIADKYGRKKIFFYDLLIFGLAMIAAGFSSSAYLIGSLFFLSGIGVGGEFAAGDTYTAEMMPAQKRGRGIAVIYTIAVLAGPIIAGLGYLLSHHIAGSDSWRILLWIMGGAALIGWIIRLKVPESPRWLESHGHQAEADAAMTAIENEVMKHEKLASLPPVKPMLPVKPHKIRYRDIFAPDVKRKTIMMLVFEFFQSGIFYGFTTLAPTFLYLKGVTLVTTLLFTMVIYSGFFVGSLFSIYIIDKVERKWGIVATAIIAGVLGVLFAVITNIAVVVILGFVICFDLWNFSNFFHAYQAEIFPTKVRSTAAGAVYGVSRISTAILVLFITDLILPHGLAVTFIVIWIFVLIVVIDIAVFGPRASRIAVEDIVQ